MKIPGCKMDEYKRIVECYQLDPSVCFLIFREMASEAMPLLLARVEELEKFEPPVCEQCGEYMENDPFDPGWQCGECE